MSEPSRELDSSDDRIGDDLDEAEQVTGEQEEEAVAFATQFLTRVIRLRGVRIDRESYLRQTLRTMKVSDDRIEQSIQGTPLQAGIPLSDLDALARTVIAFETNKSAALSFASGLPGGLYMAATVPADVTQYYVHAFRVMQKLAYLYGWQDFITDLDEVDDETLAKFAVFLGVMMGVGGASKSLAGFAARVAAPAIQKQVSKQALTKTVWYGPMKKTLRFVGVKITKDTVGKAAGKVVPVIGGVISGSMTMVSLRSQSGRLMSHLRELPPPGMDAALFAELLDRADLVEESTPGGRIAAAHEGAGQAVGAAGAGIVGAAGSAWEATGGARDGARSRGRSLVDSVRRRRRADASDDQPVDDTDATERDPRP